MSDCCDTKYNSAMIAAGVGVREALKTLGILEVLDDEGKENTPLRIAKAWTELTSGLQEDPKSHLSKNFDVDHKELVLVKDIPIISLCEHHFMPFYGVAHIAYVPNEFLTGLSKLARMVDGYARRPQVQERLTTQTVEAIMEVLQPLGAAVVIDCVHTCMSCRGALKAGSSTVTSAVRGCFDEEASARAELMQLIKS